jgi:hypothetical protein
MLRTFVRRYHHYGEERIATLRGKIMKQNQYQEPMVQESKCKFEPPSSPRGLSNQEDENPDSLCEAKREVLIFDSSPLRGDDCGAVAGFRRNAALRIVSPTKGSPASGHKHRRCESPEDLRASPLWPCARKQ